MNGMGMIIFLVIIIGVFYFITIRPQRKQEKERLAMISSVTVGDSILTTSGFYGVVIDMPDDDVVIVDFGSDKHCRIPMKRDAIVEVDKAE